MDKPKDSSVQDQEQEKDQEQEQKFESPMALAMALAQAAFERGDCAPNPAVGAVLVNPQGQVIGQGQTQAPGGAHAEIRALQDAAEHGHDTQGATAYVTLEPCSHQGRTGPCCDALIAAGVHRVVASLQDPNPLVSGQGFAKLRAAGVDVQIGDHAAEAEEIQRGFLTRMRTGRPWVRCKVGASLDGRTALNNGVSQWITSPEARADGQRWRARAQAILTGVGTILADDPLLNVRTNEPHTQPALVVLDRAWRTPADAKIFTLNAQSVPPRRLWFFAPEVGHQNDSVQTNTARASLLQAKGAEWVKTDPSDLGAVLDELGRRGINELHVEAGATLTGALLSGGWVDEVLLYLAPTFLGPGRPLAELPELTQLSTPPSAWQFTETKAVGPDLRIRLRRR